MPEKATADQENAERLEPAIPAARPERRMVVGARLAAAAQVVLATIAVLVVCYFAKLVFVILLVAILLSFVLAPIADVLERIRFPRSLSALIAVLIFTGAICGASYYSYNRALDFAHELPRYSGHIRRILSDYMQKAERIQKSTQSVLPPSTNQPQRVVVQQNNWATYLSTTFGSVTDFLLAIGFIPFLVYFMLSWREHVRGSTVMLFRLENRNTAYVTLGAIAKMIRSFIVGNFVVGLFMGAVMMFVFGLIGLPYFYFIGLISGFLSLVPYLGVILAMVPPLMLGFGRIHSTDAIIIVVTVLVSHLLALNVLYPKIVGGRVRLNPLAVTLALLFWGFLWGAWGLILAVPITAAMKIIFDHVESLRAYGAWLGE
jgi:predicted PurR-regulated permease PerM